jgi:hypothetical protein
MEQHNVFGKPKKHKAVEVDRSQLMKSLACYFKKKLNTFIDRESLNVHKQGCCLVYHAGSRIKC